MQKQLQFPEPRRRTSSVSAVPRAVKRTASSINRKAARAAGAAVGATAQPVVAFVKHISKYWSSAEKKLTQSPSAAAKLKAPATPMASTTPLTMPTPSTGSSDDDARVVTYDIESEVVDDSQPETEAEATTEATPAVMIDLQPEEKKETVLPPAKSLQAAILKHGVPWRGTYSRTLRVGEGKIITVDPATGVETNSWESPRDAPKAEAKVDSALVEVHVAPFPHAPPFLHQRLRFSCSSQAECANVLSALSEAGVAIQAY